MAPDAGREEAARALRARSCCARLAVAGAAALLALVGAEFAGRALFPLRVWRRPLTYLVRDGQRVPVTHEALKLPGRRDFRPNIVFETCYDVRWGTARSYMEPGPDSRGSVEARINSEGLRGPLVPDERAGSTYRFVALGDSFTFGHGVPFEATWPEAL